MKCGSAENMAFLYAHGELDGVRKLSLEGHLGRCSSCRSYWRRCVAERDALRQSLGPLPEPSTNMPSLADEVRARIRRLEPAESRPARVRPTATHRVAIALAVALLAMGLSAAAAYLPQGVLPLWGVPASVSGPEGPGGCSGPEGPAAVPTPAAVVPVSGKSQPAQDATLGAAESTGKCKDCANPAAAAAPSVPASTGATAPATVGCDVDGGK